MTLKKAPRPDYGVDAPGVGLRIFSVLIAALAIALFLQAYPGAVPQRIAAILFSIIPTGFILIVLMFVYVRYGKFMHRNKMLDALNWNGDEQVLDIGTGHGLLMIGAAKRLNYGKSFGIDIWNQEDLSDNKYESALRNAELEGVQDRIEIIRADARQTGFADNYFDYVLSNLCLHNIPGREQRASACREIARILKPGGTALICDYRCTGEYARELAKLGLETSRSLALIPAPMILHIVKAVKK